MPAALGLGPPVQIAYVVADAARAAHEWSTRLGAGPFFLRSHIELVDVTYRGRSATFDHTAAYGQWGPLMLELVQDHGSGPSIVRERFAPGESGLHHLAFLVDDVATTLERLADAGIGLAMRARTVGGVEFHFADALATHGHFVEIYARTDRLVEFYATVAGAAVGWDGADPVRTA